MSLRYFSLNSIVLQGFYHTCAVFLLMNFTIHLLLISFLCFSTIRSQAQQIPPTRFWLSPGVGKTSHWAVLNAAGFEPRNSQSVFIARYSVNGEIAPRYEPGIKTGEVGLLYGRRLKNWRFSGGLAYIYGNFRGNYLYTQPSPLMGTGDVYEYIGYKTVGIPAEIRYIAAFKYVGIGLTVFGNMNDKRSFLGLSLSMYAGKFD